jgi:FKBP-type peptidyl-prolyl cis-trans isomerase (trigger factor)
MKQPQIENTPAWSEFININTHDNPIMRTITISVPANIVQTIYQQALIAQQKNSQPYGLHQKVASLNYIEHTYHTHLTEQVNEFLFKFFVINILFNELRNKKIILAGDPRLTGIEIDENQNTLFHFIINVFSTIEPLEWKYFPFKAPKRKRYQDLDRQVETFIEEEEHNKESYHSTHCIQIDDWINFDVTLANDNKEPLLDYNENLWLKLCNEEADTIFQELFLGKQIGDVIYTDNEGLREYFNEQTGSNFNFCVTIKDIVPHSYVCIEQLKKQFRIKTNKELHQKLVEVFSYRNDISQRKAMIDEACKLMLTKHAFQAPHFLILRQQEELLASVQSNPDYLVYKMQKDFKRSIEQLAERQVKETMLMDHIAYTERLEISHDDVKSYLNLTKRQRIREFIHFRLPETKVRGQEMPLITYELMNNCLREKTLNYIIFHLTKK